MASISGAPSDAAGHAARAVAVRSSFTPHSRSARASRARTVSHVTGAGRGRGAGAAIATGSGAAAGPVAAGVGAAAGGVAAAAGPAGAAALLIATERNGRGDQPRQ